MNPTPRKPVVLRDLSTTDRQHIAAHLKYLRIAPAARMYATLPHIGTVVIHRTGKVFYE